MSIHVVHPYLYTDPSLVIQRNTLLQLRTTFGYKIRKIDSYHLMENEFTLLK